MQEGQPQNEPGWVFKPGDQSPKTEAAPAPVTSQPAPQEPAPLAQTETVEPDTQQEPISDNSQEGHVEWTASEYLANPKSSGWYGLLAICSVTLAVIVWFLTGGDFVSTIVIAIVGIMVGVFAARQPRTLTYHIDNRGLSIGEKFYPYESFKSFSVADDQAIGYISLQTLKRFMPPLTVHFSPEDEGRITETLALYLPFEDHKPDMVDNFTRRLRF